jgi:hypothetical protein
MTTDLVLRSTDEAFSLSERICKSTLVPQAYRGKPIDAAIAMLYGAELGFAPMTSLQRIVVINGKPSCDAQGMVSLIRQAGHSISGDVTSEGATVKGKRGDNGDEMTASFTAQNAQDAGLLRNDTYKKYAEDMYWARAVSRLGRRLFADVLLSVSYVPEEADSIPANGNGNGHVAPAAVTESEPPAAIGTTRKVRQPPGTAPAAEATVTEEGAPIVDAEVVDEPQAAPVADGGKKATVQQLNKIRKLLKATDEEAARRCGEILNRPVADLFDLSEVDAATCCAQIEGEF